MRAVALSDPKVQEWVAAHATPLKVVIKPGTARLPLDWPAMSTWSIAYAVMGAGENQGFTGCSLVSPDGLLQYANTGSAMVWEMFDSTAYDRDKFLAMLERGRQRHERYRGIQADPGLGPLERRRKLAEFRRTVSAEVRNEGRAQAPPRGFSLAKALELFRLSGDIKD